MLPSSSADHMMNSALVNAVLLRKLANRELSKSDLADGLIVQLGDGISRSGQSSAHTRARLSALGNLVQHVVERSTEKQMAGIDTPAVVAPVAYEESVRDVSVPMSVSQTMSAVSLVIHVEPAVAVTGRATHPRPTRIGSTRWVDGCKELIKFVGGYTDSHHRGPFSVVGSGAFAALPEYLLSSNYTASVVGNGGI